MNASSDYAVEIRNLVKRFREDGEPAIDGIDLCVPVGSVFGLVGGNGAGKTTILRALLGLCTPTSGETFVFGEESRALSRVTRQRIGYLSEDEFPHDDLTVFDAVRYVRGFYDDWDWDWCDHLVERLGVQKYVRLDDMSKGQRRVAELLLAVAPSPDLLVLDDPAIGLDPTVRRKVLWTLLETATERGATVLFSSHILQDVERVVDHVAILQNGKIRACGELDALKQRVRRIVVPSEGAPEAVDGELQRQSLGREVSIVTDSWSEALAARFESAEVSSMNLEDMFLAVTESSVETLEKEAS